MALDQDLLKLEKKFWTGSADFYREHLDAKCLCAFSEMAGVMTNEEIAKMVKEGQDWQDVKLTEKGFIQPTPEFAVVTYEANAKKPTGEPYRAHVSSGYIKRNGEWKMALHQQTPMKS